MNIRVINNISCHILSFFNLQIYYLLSVHYVLVTFFFLIFN